MAALPPHTPHPENSTLQCYHLSISLAPPLTARVADAQRTAVPGVVDEHGRVCRNKEEHFFAEGSTVANRGVSNGTDQKSTFLKIHVF
jgi:hypothetical protein